MELSVDTAAAWLGAQGLPDEDLQFTELGGGVSNRVVRAEGRALRAVLKQSLGRLRVEQEWLSERSRIFREAAAMRWLDGKIRGGRVPLVLREDREEFLIAMEAAPAGAGMWKELLFAGQLAKEHARSAGQMLGSLIACSFESSEARKLFGDQTVFDQLRIDPYYRFTAQRHPDLAPRFEKLMDHSAKRAVSLVHGDWSPKNLLVCGEEMWAIDWEVVHYGDPSFDVAFLLNHLLLKSIALPQHEPELKALASVFLGALREELPAAGRWIEDAATEHLPALLLARVDGKSPAEYLTEPMRDRAREKARSLLRRDSVSFEEIFAS